MNNYNYKCVCGKKYVRRFAYNNHILQCNLSRYCINISNNKDTTNSDINITNPHINISNPDITHNNSDINLTTIFKMLVNLNNKYEKLQDNYDEIKKYIVYSKNKIDIIDYLNKNYNYTDYDFINFIDDLIIDKTSIQKIFKLDYVDGIFNIIIDYINKIKSDGLNIPIKAFDHKEGVLYIYSKEMNGWIVFDSEYYDLFIKRINKILLNLFLEWKVENESKMDDEAFSQIYVLNMKRILGSNFENKNPKIAIKNRLYKSLKSNLKNIVVYEFQ